MEGLFTHAQMPHDTIGQCAVAITGNNNSRHSGLFYRDPDSHDVLFFHLMTDNLHVVDPDGYQHAAQYLRGSPSASKLRHGDIAAKADLVYKGNATGRMPYGFSNPENFFEKTTGLIITDRLENVGLTCATLLLAIFHLAGFHLIDYTTWHPRDDDFEAQQSLYQFLEKNKDNFGLGDNALNAISNQINGIRYRPEEVTAAAITDPDINTMEQLAPLGEQVVKKLLNP